MTDIQGAHLASVQSIGYANKPGKRERLTAAGAGAIINSLADLALRLRARVANPELLQFPTASRAHLRRAEADGPGRDSEDARTSTESVNERPG